MTVKHALTQGVGFGPTTLKYIPTLGFGPWNPIGYKISATVGDQTNFSHALHAPFYASLTSKWYCIAQDSTGDDNALWVKDQATPAAYGLGGGWSQCQVEGGTTVVYPDGRDSSDIQTFWDDANRQLHVYGGNSTSLYSRLYLENSGKWTFQAGANKSTTQEDMGAALASDPTGGFKRGLVVDSTGRIWVVGYAEDDDKLYAWYRTGVGAWTAVAIEASAPFSMTYSNCAVTRCLIGGQPGLFAVYTYCTPANGQGDVRAAYRLDSAAPDDAWTKETALTTPTHGVDSHITLMAYEEGVETTSRIHVVYKSDTGSHLKHCWRSAAGAWTNVGTVVSAKSRPVLLFEATNQILYLYHGSGPGQDGPAIEYCTTDLPTISWSADQVVLQSDGTTSDMNDPVVASHNVTAAMGMLVVCEQKNLNTYWNLFAINTPPVVNAGSDQTITLPATAQLDATVSDDGLPASPGTTTPTWTKHSGPGTVDFSPNANTVDAVAAFSEAGTYVLRLSVTDGEFTTTDDVQVVVNAAPASSAGTFRQLAVARGRR